MKLTVPPRHPSKDSIYSHNGSRLVRQSQSGCNHVHSFCFVEQSAVFTWWLIVCFKSLTLFNYILITWVDIDLELTNVELISTNIIEDPPRASRLLA
jgi:hypothetical protein